MRITKNLLGIVVAVGIASCGNSKLESRITKLEGRVAAIESSTGITTVTSTTQPPIAAANNTSATTPTPVVEKPEGPLPVISFEKTLHDFGTIKDGDVVEHIFSFVNEGEIPLIISDAKATCGCTVPEWPREPIPVGEKGDIKVRFSSKNRVGIQNKTVTLTANTWPATTQVKIKANVVKAEE